MDDSPSPGVIQSSIRVLRWLCVVPVAYLASWLFGGVLVFLLSLVGFELRGPNLPAFLFPLWQALPRGVALTLAGALTAPQRRIATGALLIALCIPVSLFVHILGPSNPGLTNYMHATGESLGALLGVGVVHYLGVRGLKRAATSAEA